MLAVTQPVKAIDKLPTAVERPKQMNEENSEKDVSALHMI
jgi:hypothetical protein